MNFKPDAELESLMQHIKSYQKQLFEYYKSDVIFWQTKIAELQNSKNEISKNLEKEKHKMDILQSKKLEMQKELSQLQSDYNILLKHNKKLENDLQNLNNAKKIMHEIVWKTPLQNKTYETIFENSFDSIEDDNTEVSFTFTMEDDFVESSKTILTYNNYIKIMNEYRLFKERKQSKELTIQRTENLFMPEYPELFNQFKHLLSIQ